MSDRRDLMIEVAYQLLKLDEHVEYFDDRRDEIDTLGDTHRNLGEAIKNLLEHIGPRNWKTPSYRLLVISKQIRNNGLKIWE